MVGVAARGTVTSIKALWETRIKKIQEEEKEEERRKSRAGITRRSASKPFLWLQLIDNFNHTISVMKSLYCYWSTSK